MPTLNESRSNPPALYMTVVGLSIVCFFFSFLGEQRLRPDLYRPKANLPTQSSFSSPCASEPPRSTLDPCNLKAKEPEHLASVDLIGLQSRQQGWAHRSCCSTPANVGAMQTCKAQIVLARVLIPLLMWCALPQRRLQRPNSMSVPELVFEVPAQSILPFVSS